MCGQTHRSTHARTHAGARTHVRTRARVREQEHAHVPVPHPAHEAAPSRAKPRRNAPCHANATPHVDEGRWRTVVAASKVAALAASQPP